MLSLLKSLGEKEKESESGKHTKSEAKSIFQSKSESIKCGSNSSKNNAKCADSKKHSPTSKNGNNDSFHTNFNPSSKNNNQDNNQDNFSSKFNPSSKNSTNNNNQDYSNSNNNSSSNSTNSSPSSGSSSRQNYESRRSISQAVAGSGYILPSLNTDSSSKSFPRRNHNEFDSDDGDKKCSRDR